MTESATAKTLIESEWEWQAGVPPIASKRERGGPKIDDWVLWDELVWRGMRFGWIEAFYESGPWYGNSGGRTGPIMSLEGCRRAVEAKALQHLKEALTVQEKRP